MDEDMKTLYVIGNGFDLFHKLDKPAEISQNYSDTCH